MDENRESQELAIPGQIVKRKTGITSRVQNILRSGAQAITKPLIEQAPEEMSVERAREILKYIVNIPEGGLDAHERHLTPQEQLKRFGGIHYADIKKHLVYMLITLLQRTAQKTSRTLPIPTS